MKLKHLAKIYHENIRMLQEINSEKVSPPWEDTPDWMIEGTFDSINFHLANPAASASASHENWMGEKIRTGWRFGPVKDPDKKTHPLLIPFSELPAEQQMKDILGKALIDTMSKYIED